MPGVPSTEITEVAEEFAEGVLRRSPTTATSLGDRRFDDRLPDIGPEGRAEERAALLDLREKLSRIDRSSLAGEDAITHHMLELAADYGLASLDRQLYHLAVDQVGGPQVSFAMLLNWHTMETEQNTRDLLARFRAFPGYMDQYLGNLQEGASRERTSPRIAVERVIGQLTALLATSPEASPYGRTAQKALGDLSHQLLAAIRNSIYPAFEKLLNYLETEYIPVAREEPGLCSIPEGEETYAELVRQATQSDFTPEQIHQIGIEELQGIHEEMRALGMMGVTGVREYSEKLKADPANHFMSREELLQAAQELYDQAYAALPELFGHLPATPCRVIPIEEYREKDSMAAFYYPPSQDGSRPGTYYVNTYRPDTRPRYNLPALTLHEAVPGHHLQIAIQNEAQGVPRFRRHELGTDGALTAFTEGWGLYSERLGTPMGMYSTDLERFGMLSYQAWRAARLVVDSGIHALRWPRERAIQFMLDNVGLPENEVVNEVDRYIVWPSQALAYKMGQRHIEALRRQAEERLEGQFDLRAFHDELLRHGAIPLTTATFVIERWIEGQHEHDGNAETENAEG
ncbi:MAG: DUF885 domain-containing protein [Chloroflexi bacterium]|nr:DUF885 domain-containing protein [Chloroflexota bacterium]